MHGDGRGPCADEGPSRTSRLACRLERRAGEHGSASVYRDHPAFHHYGERASRQNRPCDSAVARQVLLGLAFDATGHRLQGGLHRDARHLAAVPMSIPAARRGYLDWVRGLAVLIMIQAHVLDSWTRLDARGSWQFSW